MLLDDFKALLWAYGGNLGSGSGHVDPDAARQPELFLLTASHFISSDARLATCVFNLVIEMASKFSPQALEKKMQIAAYDPRRLGILISIVRSELARQTMSDEPKEWETIEASLRRAVNLNQRSEPLISHLPDWGVVPIREKLPYLRIKRLSPKHFKA